jgi:hypothetical protein
MPEINEAIALNAGSGDPMEHDCGGRLVYREIDLSLTVRAASRRW